MFFAGKFSIFAYESKATEKLLPLCVPLYFAKWVLQKDEVYFYGGKTFRVNQATTPKKRIFCSRISSVTVELILLEQEINLL
jgi:hypothetical protein